MPRSVERRKVQRLGHSSLVVTLPKDWARRVGLKPGDEVLVADEGEWVRIRPARGKPHAEVNVDVGELRVPVDRVILCAYLLGYDVLRLRGLTAREAAEARRVASSLAGAEALPVASGTLEVRIFVDSSKLDPNAVLRSIAGVVSEVLESAARILEGASPGDLESRASELYSEALRLVHLVNRVLIAEAPMGGRAAALMIAAALAGLAATISVDLVRLIAARGAARKPTLARLVLEAKSALEEVFAALASSSLERALRASDKLRELRRKLEDVTVATSDAVEAMVAARLLDVVETLTAVNGVATCASLEGRLAGGKR